jgi:hypothetical protein
LVKKISLRSNIKVEKWTQAEHHPACISKGKAIWSQAWTVALGFQEVEAARITKQSEYGGGKVASPMHWLTLQPADIPETHFC